MNNQILQLVGGHLQRFQNNQITSNEMWEDIVEDLDDIINEEKLPEVQDEILELVGSEA